MIEKIEKTIKELVKVKPIILCLTNTVTVQFVANCLLALGAAPIMSHSAEEMKELVKISSAININIGTLDDNFIRLAELCAATAKRYGKPITLDPVGSGASNIRTETSVALLKYADIVKGNASEILSLGSKIHGTLGVESTNKVSEAYGSAVSMAKHNDVVVVVSGENDLVVGYKDENSKHISENYINFGSPLMPLITGMGCSLAAVIAAFSAIVPSRFEAAELATSYFGLCGSIAQTKTNKPGTFLTLFIDELYSPDFPKMRDIAKI